MKDPDRKTVAWPALHESWLASSIIDTGLSEEIGLSTHHVSSSLWLRTSGASETVCYLAPRLFAYQRTVKYGQSTSDQL